MPRVKKKTFTFKKSELPSLLARAKKIIFPRKSKSELLYNKNTRMLHEDVKRKCMSHTMRHSRCDERMRSAKPMLPPYILTEYRTALLRHDWSAAKKLLLLFINARNTCPRIAWKMSLTAFVHFPGAEEVLREFVDVCKGTYNEDDFLRGILTINGMEQFQASQPDDIEEDDYSDEDDNDDDDDLDLFDDLIEREEDDDLE